MEFNGTNQSRVTFVCYGLQTFEYRPTIAYIYTLLFTSTFNIVVGVISTTANSLVIFVILQDKQLRTKTNQLLMLLSVTDVQVGAVTIPLSVTNRITAMHEIHLCSLHAWHSFFAYLLCVWSVAGVCAISVDRYVATNHTVMFRRASYHRKKKKMLLSFWVLWLLFIPLPYLRLVSFKIFNILVSGIIIISLVVVCWCYFKVIQKLKANAKKQQENQDSSIPRTFTRQASHFAVKKKITISALVAMAFFISLSPRFVMILVLAIIGRDFNKVAISGMYTESFVYLNSAVNPIIYLWRLPDVRRAVFHIFQRARH